MDDEAAAANKVAWSWVLGALVRFRELNASVIFDLFERCPEIFGYLDKDGTEVVALRCLEELFAPCDGSENENITCNHSRIGLDSSNSCVDVLNCLLQEVLLSNTGRPVTEHLKCDVQSFVECKKASLPKSMLEKLKDAILLGTFPVPNSMKTACELLVKENHDLRIHTEDGKEVACGSKLVEVGTDDEVTVMQAGDGKALHENSPRSTSSASVTNRNDLTDQISPRDSLSSGGSMENVDNQQNASMYMVTENECATHSEILMAKRLDDAGSEDDQRTTVVQNLEDDELNDPRPAGIMSAPESVAAKDMANQGNIERSKGEKDIKGGMGNNLCKKCNEGGEMLICSTNGCDFAIHHRCLCCPLTFDGTGKFCCPLCAYSHAVSGYTKAKKNVSLARKELSLFIGRSRSSRPHDHSSGADPSDFCREKSVENPDEMDEGDHVDGFIMPEEEDIHRHESFNPPASGMIPVDEGNLEAMHPPSYGLKESKENAKVNEKQLSGGPKQQEIGSGVAHCHEPVINSHKDEAFFLKHQPGVGVELEFLCVPAPVESEYAPSGDGLQNTVKVDNGHDTVEPSQENEDRALSRKVETVVEIEVGVSRQVNPDQPAVATSESVTYPDGTIDDYRGSASSSRHCMVRRARKDCISYQAFPQLKRKKVPWSAEEEKMLKEGMAKFAENESNAIPWKSIREFGNSVFHEDRTPGDLKNKWRNMMMAKKHLLGC